MTGLGLLSISYLLTILTSHRIGPDHHLGKTLRALGEQIRRKSAVNKPA
jgi:hypothetical protein